MRSMHPAVFLVNIMNFKSIIAFLPLLHQLGCVVCGAVVYDQPDKVFAILAAQAFIGARKSMGSVVCGSKYGEYGFSNSVHKR